MAPAPIRRANYKRMLERLRSARKEAGLTQAEVAKRLGKPQSYVSKCELGERRIDPLELAAFAKVYGRSVAWFVGEEEC